MSSTEQALYEALAKAFERNTVFGHMHSYDLYRKWLEAVWAFLDAFHNPQGYKDCLDKFTFKEGSELGRLLAIYTDAAERMPFRDILGELFMRLDINSVRSGQFFTPGSLAEMMVRMQFSKEGFEAAVAEKGEVTVCDPAVGSGVMLLAFGKLVSEECGRSALRHLKLYGTDIDERCVLMTRIQLRMNGLDSFGRMAGRLGHFSQPHETNIPSPSASRVDIFAPESSEISNAVIINNKEELIVTDQMQLF